MTNIFQNILIDNTTQQNNVMYEWKRKYHYITDIIGKQINKKNFIL